LLSHMECLYIGMFYATAVIGPVVAFIGGGFLLQVYTHFDTIDTSASVQVHYVCH